MTTAALCLLLLIAASASVSEAQFWSRWDGSPWWLNQDQEPTQRPQVRPRPRPTPPTTISTTAAAAAAAGGGVPVDSFGRVAGCDCPAPPQYNPVCGSDGVTYNNPQILECANRCGHPVTISFIGLCVAG
ncbi:uncharacterized protein LOC126414019 [Schistocerca serialis cubense]|uniref:uncharacterized protein LOC126414019 n=1 Tax=Schistocerca serialis cubense TaxID=2023355 RepID=UPI00214F1FF1|nr:uncharacterized protein LOC126414019 [Schistocerca serialis cubense]